MRVFERFGFDKTSFSFSKKYSLTYCKTYLFKTKDLLERHIQKNIELHSLYSRRYLGPHRTRSDIFEIHWPLHRPKNSTRSTEISKPQKISDQLGPNGPRTKRHVDPCGVQSLSPVRDTKSTVRGFEISVVQVGPSGLKLLVLVQRGPGLNPHPAFGQKSIEIFRIGGNES